MQKDMLEKAYKPAIIAGFFALVISSLLIVIKLFAWLHTFSTIIMASLVDSMTDFAISLLNFFALRAAKKPADINHRYGHGKIEGLASIFQGAFMSAAAFFILLEAVHRLAEPLVIKAPFIALSVMAVSLVLTILLVLIQARSLNASYSLAVEADQMHYKGDIAVHLGVMAVLAAGYFGAPAWVDPFGAICIAGYLAFNAYHIAQKGVDMLLDKEVGGETREKIIQIVLAHKDIHDMHDLRTRYNGNTLHIALDVEMEPELLLCKAHGIVKELEEKLLEIFPNAEIMIHKDPIGETEDSRHQVKGVHI